MGGASGDKGDPAGVNIQDSDVSGRGGDKGAAGVHLKSGLAPRWAEVDAELLFRRR